MSAWEATSFFQWVCGIEVGGAINLLFAIVTVFIAGMAVLIQKDQKKTAQKQTDIMETLSRIEAHKFKREERTFKNKLFDSILHLTARVAFNAEDKNVSKERMEFYALHRKEVPDYFPDEVQVLCKLYADYHSEKSEEKARIKESILKQWVLIYPRSEDYF